MEDNIKVQKSSWIRKAHKKTRFSKTTDNKYRRDVVFIPEKEITERYVDVNAIVPVRVYLPNDDLRDEISKADLDKFFEQRIESLVDDSSELVANINQYEIVTNV